jgi:hypothetical protein
MRHARTLPLLALVGLAISVAVAAAAETSSVAAAKGLAAGGGKPILIEFWMPG